MPWEKINNFIINNGKILISIGITIALTIIILVVLKIIINRTVKRAKNKRAITLSKLVHSILKYIIVIIAIIIVIGLTGYDITAVLAGAGIAGLIIGLGAQSLINDMLSGIAIVFEDYLEIDDVIEVNGFKGKVVDIGLRSIKIQNWKGELRIITNGQIKELTNFSRTHSLAVVEFSIDYKENINEVVTMLEERLQNMKEFFPQIVEGPNVVGIIKIGLNGFDIRLTAKTLCEEHYAVERGLQKKVIELFKENNMELSMNQFKIVGKDER